MRRGFVPVYVQRASPLQSARAGATAGLCGALALVCALFEHPLVLLAVLAGVLGCALAAGAGGQLMRALRLGIPLAILIAVINPLVYQEGDTLLIRGGEVLGRRFDVTLEAVAAGGLAGFRVIVFLMTFALFSACVDPDEMLRLFRRVSYRSALTAALATRLVPVLARDALRMGDAARCRAQPAGRLAVSRAALSGALDRAVDVAAALEVRGYSVAGKPQRVSHPWSRHDVRVAAAAILIATTALVVAVLGGAGVEQYPRLEVGLDASTASLSVMILLGSAMPFVGRSARLGVSRV
jgi:energy-coupling factor transport system permease protein